MNKLELQKTAVEVRKGIVEGVHAAKAGHPGGSLSAADILSMTPYDNFISTFGMKGKDVRRMFYNLHEGSYTALTSGVVQVVRKKPVKKLVSIKIFDGINEIEIDDKKIYSVTTNDFCMPYKDGVLGGDDFRRVTKWIKPQNKKNHGELREALKEYLKLIPELIKSNYVDENNPRLRIIKAQNE